MLCNRCTGHTCYHASIQFPPSRSILDNLPTFRKQWQAEVLATTTTRSLARLILEFERSTRRDLRIFHDTWDPIAARNHRAILDLIRQRKLAKRKRMITEDDLRDPEPDPSSRGEPADPYTTRDYLYGNLAEDDFGYYLLPMQMDQYRALQRSGMMVKQEQYYYIPTGARAGADSAAVDESAGGSENDVSRPAIDIEDLIGMQQQYGSSYN